MGGRSIKGHVAHISTGFLRLLNWIIVAGALTSIVILFVINKNPIFPYGWGFILLGVVTIISGLFGAISSGQLGCFGIHMIFMLLSSLGLCASFVLIFLKLNLVLNQIEYDLPRLDAKQLLRVLGAIYFILFSTQLVVFLLASLIEGCGFIDYYEDLEGQPLAPVKTPIKKPAPVKERIYNESYKDSPSRPIAKERNPEYVSDTEQTRDKDRD